MAVKVNGDVLYYVSNELKNCQEICLEAVKANGIVFTYVSNELKNSK